MTGAREMAPISLIVGELAARAELLCRELLPGGRREGAEWVVDSGDSPLGCSLAVHLHGARAGVWSAWAAAIGGDALDLVRHCAELQRHRRAADTGEKSAALRWAREWLGYDSGGGAAKPPPARRATSPAGGMGDDDAAEVERRRKAAFNNWLTAQPSLKSTPAEDYLLARGIDLGLLGRQPRALRFHPNLWNERTRRHWPALVAVIARGGQPVAVHRIWLEVRHDGSVGKAPIFDAKGDNKAKQALGPYAGGVIALWRGADGKSLAQAPAGSAVWISEGIEDGLAMALLTGGAERVLAAVSLSNMRNLVLPAAIAEVGIVAQADPCWSPGRDQPHPTISGLDKAIRHFQDEGRTVRLWRVPDEAAAMCKDANDYLQFRDQASGIKERGEAA